MARLDLYSHSCMGFFNVHVSILVSKLHVDIYVVISTVSDFHYRVIVHKLACNMYVSVCPHACKMSCKVVWNGL